MSLSAWRTATRLDVSSDFSAIKLFMNEMNSFEELYCYILILVIRYSKSLSEHNDERFIKSTRWISLFMNMICFLLKQKIHANL